MNVRGIDPRRHAVQHRMKSAKRAAIAEILQDVDRKLLIALRPSPTVQAVEPQVFTNIAVQCFGPPFVQDRIDDACPGFTGTPQQAKHFRLKRAVRLRTAEVGNQCGLTRRVFRWVLTIQNGDDRKW